MTDCGCHESHSKGDEPDPAYDSGTTHPGSEEIASRRGTRIMSSILADRLERLIGAGVLTRGDDPTHK